MEKLSGGGTSSGLMSFLEVLDRGAGATKSGGTTRRAAKMVVLDLDHPEIVDFIRWKVREEKKVGALVAAGYSSDFNGDAYGTVSGQNSNNSVRVPDKFMQAVAADGTWETTFRTTGQVHQSYKARELWREIADSAWQCADPGVQYDDTIQRWHTCKNTDRIFATNPCSEFVFLDDTACNLASINLLKFPRPGRLVRRGRLQSTRTVCSSSRRRSRSASPRIPPRRSRSVRTSSARSVSATRTSARCSWSRACRTTAEPARAYAGALTAIMTGEAYALSAEMASSKGPFRGLRAEPALDARGHAHAPRRGARDRPDPGAA
jgi:ribonucleoside-diphosphate reductase alpha chain